MCKRSCFSISGLQYRAIHKGPVPANYESLFEYLVNQGVVDISYIDFDNNVSGTRFLPGKEKQFDITLFSKAELKVLEDVVDHFKNSSTSKVIEQSHKENAWLKNHENRNLISYTYAFELNM